MSFGVWFGQWIDSFIKLLNFDKRKKHKSRAQRKKESERRLKSRIRNLRANYYRKKKERRRRRKSYTVYKERFTRALFRFTAKSLGILLLPFGLVDWGRKSVKARKAARSAAAKTEVARAPASSRASKPAKTTSDKKAAVFERPAGAAVKASMAQTNTPPHKIKSVKAVPICLSEHSEPETSSPVIENAAVAEPDESAPKSTPKKENDRYIHKRMIIAGSQYCNKAVLDTLSVGSYIDLESEPDNPYDKNAVKLLYNGRKIGYIAKKDLLAFVTCLKLNRKIYGVITAITEENGKAKFEYETWFESN